MIQIIIFLIIIILLFLIMIYKNKFISHFSLYNQIIKDNEITDEIKLDKSSILLGDESQHYITYKTKFYFFLTKTYYNNTKIIEGGIKYPKYKDVYYLNNGVSCPKQSPDIPCLKKESENITECVFSSNTTIKLENNNYEEHIKNLDNLNNTGLWSFYDSERIGRNGIIHYGDEISIKNLGTQTGYICMCDSSGMINGTRCGNVVDIYCYDDFKEVNKYGKWIIIPSYAKNEDLYYHYSNSDIFSECDGMESESKTFDEMKQKQKDLYGDDINNDNFVKYLDEDGKLQKKFVGYQQIVADEIVLQNTCNSIDTGTIMNIKHTNTLYDNESIETSVNKTTLSSGTPTTSGTSNKNNDKVNTNLNDLIKNANKQSNFDFYANHEMNDDIYDFDTLKGLKIPVKLTDSFLIINKEKINKKYVYLNICLDNDDLASAYTLNCSGNFQTNGNETRTKSVGSIPFNTKLNNFKTKEVQIYNWGIQPIKYDINVTDTMFVKGSINLNGIDIDTKTLNYIKNMPVHFDKEICLKDSDNNKTKCIDKTHIEMLNGSRPINVKSVVPLKPFNLFSKINYTGRQLKIGFNYDKATNLPFLGDPTEFMNIYDNGKWLSLKIDYDESIKDKFIAIIYNKPNYGFNLSDDEDSDNSTMNLLKQSAVAEALSEEEEDLGEQTEKEKEEKKKKDSVYKVVKPPGIMDVTKLGPEWKDGIRSISFTVDKRDGDEYKQLKCMERYPFEYITTEDSVNKKGKDIKKDETHTDNFYTSNYCTNGNDNQQFYFTSYTDKNILTKKNEFNVPNKHLHFHRHGYNESHGKMNDDES